MRKHWGKTLIGLAVTVLALWWALRGEDLGQIWLQMRKGHLGLLTAAVAVATTGFLIRAMRWKILLAPVRRDTGLRSRFAAVSIGFMANNVLPLRAGEFARPYALSKMEPVSMSAAFGSLVVERFLDSIVLTLLLVVPVMLPGFPMTGALSSGFGALALRGALTFVTVLLVALVSMALWPRGFVRTAERLASKLLPQAIARPLVDALDAFLDSIALLRSPGLMVQGLLWTIGFWLFHGLSFWLGMMAFGIHTGVISAWFTEAVVGFGVAAPSAPGFIGTFHASAKFALSDVYGVDPSRSLAFAFGYWAGGWVPITLIGLWYAWRLGLSLGEVGGAEERVEASIEGAHAQPQATEGVDASEAR
ncbi:MAG: flippase-like domain-containing protein [Gemmatimonadetes bacterium]|nr:flippase-like domain-containing protein [Gemmatimonadota bacterium]